MSACVGVPGDSIGVCGVIGDRNTNLRTPLPTTCFHPSFFDVCDF